MHGQGRARKKLDRFRLGQKWTARSVIRETRKEEVKRLILDKHGVAAGSAAMFKHYQPALSEIMQSLTEDEIAEAEQLAVEWNAKASPQEAQAR